MSLSWLSTILFSLSGVSVALLALGAASIWVIRRRTSRPPAAWPAVSVLKPLCGLDDELAQNLESHLKVDYPGEWEILLGVRSPEDPAYPLARAFADRHSARVRVVVQEGEPGHNPKVNQLITLTRAARFPVLAFTDSNVRVPASFLREAVTALEEPGVGLATHLIGGVGERRLGAVLDNLTAATLLSPSLAAGSLLLGLDEVVGKALTLRRRDLDRVGGWHAVKDVLAEDQRLARMLRAEGLRVAFCPSPVLNVQIDQPAKAFLARHTRWLIIRYRTLFPSTLLEPLTLPTLLALLGAAASPTSGVAWIAFATALVGSAVFTQLSGMMLRGRGFTLPQLALLPLRDALFLVAWLSAATQRSVEWRGNRLVVLRGTRLAQPVALERVKSLQRLAQRR